MPLEPDLSLFGKISTKQDFDRLDEEWRMKKALAQAELQKMRNAAATGADLPSNIQEWNAYQQMSPEDQTRYLQMKRADQVLNLGGQMAVRSPTGGIAESYTVSPRIVDMPDFQANVAGAEAAARLGEQLKTEPQIAAQVAREKLLSEKGAEAQFNLPKVQSQTKQILDVIQGIETSPGLSASVGMPNPFKGRIPFVGNIAGSPAADFQAKLDQLGGKQFLQAFESLKGGGQITQIEGEKATNAIARMQTSQSEKEFKNALNEFKQIVLDAQVRAVQSAGQDPMEKWRNAVSQNGANPYQENRSPVFTEVAPKVAPKKGAIVDGYMFSGGNPNDQKNWKKVK